MAVAMPARIASSGPESLVAPCTAAKNSSAVSSPSRATARNAKTITATGPTAIARSSPERSAPPIERAALRIQKIIHVTKTTAATDVIASKSSRSR
jgi:hypothetical protein